MENNAAVGVNVLVMVGQVGEVRPIPGRAGKPGSAVMLLQYGPSRQMTGGAVEFVNASRVRIPSYRYPALEKKLVAGAMVQVEGHVQGVYRDGHLTTELVADHVKILSDANGKTVDEAAPEHE